jgi:ABC-type phosphate transport system auxiliary subunit
VGLDTRYGKEVQVQANTNEIKRIKLLKRKEILEQRIWSLEDQFGYDIRSYPPKYRDEYRKLQSELENIKNELERR